MRKVFSKLTAVFLAVLMMVSVLPVMPLTASAAVTSSKFENAQLDIVSSKESTLAPGVIENQYTVYDKNGDQVKMFVATADMNVDSVKVFTSYKDMDPTNFGMSKLTAQVEAFNKKAEAGDPYYQGTVVAGINASYYNMINGQPTGIFVMNGVVGNASESAGYFAVMKDGSVKIGVQGDYAKDKGNIQEALGIYTMLVIDGDICLTAGQKADTKKYPRQTIGITADNKVVIMSADGNQAPNSIGLTLMEQAQTMIDLGCVWAGHLDGGGSLTYGSKAEGSDEFKITNSPSDGSPRDISNGFIIVSTAVASYEFDHVAYNVADQYVTPGTSTEISVAGVSSTGHSADVPANITYKVVNGTYENGVFTAGSELKDSTITAMYNGKEVGTTTVHVVAPDKIEFGSSDMVVPFSKAVDLRMSATYGVSPVKIKADDISFVFSNAAIGSIQGFTFVAADSVSGDLSSTITATLKLNTAVTASTAITLGKGSEIFYDFEDGDVSDFALGYTPYNYVLPDSKVYAVTPETGKVHSGNGAMALNINYSNSLESGYQMSALQFNAGTINFENATKLGLWMYIPDETLSSWIRFTVTPITAIGEDGSITTGSTINNTVCDGSLSSGIGFVNTFEESGWHYISIDLSDYKGVQLKNGQYIMQFYISDRDGVAGTNYTVNNSSSLPGNFTFYVDDITIDYSSAVDDRDAPKFENPTYATASMADAVAIAKKSIPTVNSNVLNFAVKVADFAAGNATGLNAATAKAYIDGNEVKATYANGIISMDSVTLADGVHTVKFTICDNQGNYASVIRQVKVAAGANTNTIKLVAHDSTLDRILFGSIYYMDLVATNIELVDTVTAVIDLNSISTWNLDHMEVAEGFTATYSIQADENIATITITRTGNVKATGEAYLVSMPIRMWELRMGYIYESGTKKGQQAYTYKFFRDGGEIWHMDIFANIDMGLVTFTDGTSSTFSGERVQVDSESWINKKANMIATTAGQAYYDKWNGGHIHTAAAIADKAATCTENGYTGRTFCSVCNSVVEWGTTIPATGHTYTFVNDVLVCSCGELFNGVWTDGKTYVDGELIKDGWTDDFHYYMNGEKITGLVQIGGFYYDFGDDGICLNKARLDGFYFNTEVERYMYFTAGILSTGEVVIFPEVYFYDENGYAIAGDVELEGYTCTFDEKGAFVSSTDESVVDAGFCGTNIHYVLLADGTLIVDGEGVMKDYTANGNYPAWIIQNEPTAVTSLVIGNGITEIGRFGFYRNQYLRKVTFEENSSLKTIGWGAFGHNWRLEGVTLPASVETLEAYSFYECGAMTYFAVEEDSQLKTIKNAALMHARKLETVYIPASVVNFEADVFYQCNADMVLNVVENSTAHKYAQSYNLKFVTREGVLPPAQSGACSDTVTWEITHDGILYINGTGAIPNYASHSAQPWYKYAYTVNKIVIGKGITAIGNYAFAYGFKDVTSIEFEAGSQLQSIGVLSFMNCAAVKEIILPETVTYISAYAFGDCYALESMYLPQGVTGIYANAFNGSSKLVLDVSDGTYAHEFAVANGVAHNVRDFVYVAIDSGSCGESATWSFYENGELVISGSGAMENYANYTDQPWNDYAVRIKKITIGKDITAIGNYAFAYTCKYVTSIVIEEGSQLQSIGILSFMNCAGIKELTLPETVTSISAYAFGDCFALESLYVPQGVSFIYSSAFNGSSKLVLNVAEGTYAHEYAEARGIAFTAREFVYVSIDGGSCGESATWNFYENGELVISGSGAIANFASHNNQPWNKYAERIKKITIGKDITAIGNYAFAYTCKYVTSIVFEEGSQLQSIGILSFMNCAGVKEIILPETVTSISAYAFGDCFALESLYVPQGVTFIYFSAFNGSSKLVLNVSEGTYAHEYAQAHGIACIARDFVYVAIDSGSCGESATWSFYENGELVISGSGAIANFASHNDQPWKKYAERIKKITIGKDITAIGNYAFAYTCKYVTSIVFEEGSQLQTIGVLSFMNCAGVKEIILPETVTHINAYAFGDCFALETLYVPAGVSFIQVTAFKGTSNVTLNVAAGSYAETFATSNDIACIVR